MTGSGGLNTQTQAISGVSSAAALPGGMTEDNTTLGATTPAPGTFTTLTSSSVINSSTLATASTSVALDAFTPILVGTSTAAKTYALGKPTKGIFKYIRCRSGTTSRKTKISLAAASATVNNAKTVITLSNTGDAVTLYGETSTRWGISGSFVAGTTRIATS